MSLPTPLAVLPSRLQDLDQGARLEWLETDGRGGYAASTAVGANTRRYHGLLVVARRPPTDRVVLLSRLEETLITPAGEVLALNVNFYPGAVHPTGHRYLEEFRLDPWPVWRYRIGPLTLTKALFVARSVGATVILYHLRGGDAFLELRPLVAGRDFHALVRANDAVARDAEAQHGRVVYTPYPGIPPLVLSHDGGEWLPAGEWYYRTVYPRETERGLDDREDLFCPGVLRVPLADGRLWRMACATAPVPVHRAAEWAAAERHRRSAAAERGRKAAGTDVGLSELGARLGLAAEAFLVQRDDGLSILAGYPWFADWGRDAMISIPGLCLATGRLEEAAQVLRTFASHLKDGLIPNRFPDHGEDIPDDHYNAADASLWFIEAVAALAEKGGDVRPFWPAVQEIIDAYQHGTRFGIRLESDGLIRQGEAGIQLTWMDAKVDGRVITPRIGKAVEINALWYNALCRAADLARVLGADPSPYQTLAECARLGFHAFWYAERGYLYDVIDDAGCPDPALRPNQLLAVSLPYSPLELDQARRIVDIVERELLVPLAVRTLPTGDPYYIGNHRGTPQQRDAAYHCGTAWPWLLGPFAFAYLRVHGASAEARARIRALLATAEARMAEYGLGQIAEVVDGDPPHEPSGCFAQAWSCAELLRISNLVGGEGWPPG